MTKLTVIDGGGRGRPTALRDRRASQCIVLDRAMRGAARDVVGIRRGAISGNMKVSFQAARSIG